MSEFGNCIMQLLATIIFIAVVQVGGQPGVWQRRGWSRAGGVVCGRVRSSSWRSRGRPGAWYAPFTWPSPRVADCTLTLTLLLLLSLVGVQPWILVGIGPLAIVYYFLQKVGRGEAAGMRCTPWHAVTVCHVTCTQQPRSRQCQPAPTRSSQPPPSLPPSTPRPQYYRRSNIELQRLDAVSRSPIYAHFSETLSGVETIRAYRLAEYFALTRWAGRLGRAVWRGGAGVVWSVTGAGWAGLPLGPLYLHALASCPPPTDHVASLIPHPLLCPQRCQGGRQPPRLLHCPHGQRVAVHAPGRHRRLVSVALVAASRFCTFCGSN